jgi:hypothetical protein
MDFHFSHEEGVLGGLVLGGELEAGKSGVPLMNWESWYVKVKL